MRDVPKKKAVAKTIARKRARKETGDQGPPIVEASKAGLTNVDLAIGLQPFKFAPPVVHVDGFIGRVVKSANLQDMGYMIVHDFRNDNNYIVSADALTFEGEHLEWRAE